MDLSGKIVVVTGGAGLIGSAFVAGIAARGGIPIVAEINEEKASELIKTLPSAFYHQLDITCKDSILSLIEWCSTKFGRIDAIVNNAYPRNKNYGKHFFDVAYQDFCENLSLNIGGCFLVMQQFAEFFKKQGHGNIVNIASVYGVIAPRFEIYNDTKMTMPVEYAAIKSALIHLTKYVATYLKGTNIRVNTLTPGGVFDNQPEAFLTQYRSYCSNRGMLDPNDLVGGLVFLLSDESKMVYGQNIVIDDGFSL